MSEVTLINPLTSTKWRLPPLGLLYVAAYLEKHGVSVKVVDPLPKGREDYVSKSRYTGITCMSNQFEKTRQIARKVKRENPETIVVVGGVHPTVAVNEVRSDPNIDVVVVGEGEKAMLQIVRENVKEGVVQENRIQDLDQIPFPARHLIDMDWYLKRDSTIISKWLRSTSILTSRGCPFNCHFCVNSKHAMFGRTIRYHSPQYVEKEVEELVLDYPIEGLFFADDTFTSNNNRLIEICKRIKRFHLKWDCVSRVDTISRPVLEAMKASGCVSIGFGVESGSQKVLNALNKKAKAEDQVKAFDLCREAGIKTWAFIIIGNPEETIEDIRLTDRLLERIKADRVAISFLTPYQGTVIYDQALEKGWIVSEDANWVTDEPQMEINFTLRELREIGKYLERKHSPKVWWLKTLSRNPYFIYDTLIHLARKPTFLFNWLKS